MTAGGADTDLSFLKEDKDGDNLLSLVTQPSNEGYKILLEQAIYEMTRGSYDIALEYLNRAVQVVISIDPILRCYRRQNAIIIFYCN